MPHAIDFTELKQRVSIERAAEMLGIKTTKSGAQRRGACPICKAGGDRAFVLTPAKNLYYCFGTCSKGGDAITMTANVRNCSLREAAEFLDGKGGTSAAAAKDDNSQNVHPSPRQRTGSSRSITFRPRTKPCRPWACHRRRRRTSGRASLPRASCADDSPFRSTIRRARCSPIAAER